MKNKQFKEMAICGFAAVKELEKNTPEVVRKLYFNQEKAPLFAGLARKMAKRKGIYNLVTDEELRKISGSVHHQGVVAMIPYPEIPRLSSVDVEEWIANKENILLLDRVGNANNLGAIVRSAAFFGVKNIVIPLHEAQASITTSSYRVAQGGMEYVRLYTAQSLELFLKDIAGKIIRIGTDVHGTIPLTSLSEKTDKPKLVILGNEEEGISEEIKKLCDNLVTIPSPVDNIESLNVAQASSIILYELSKN